ncbi:TolC family protein [Cupriavidus basilensis]|uniref:TolC family protein n=1 Tax=Cupriavidus basilensis TaxID=68895 RepID=UPI0039F719F2
MLLPFPFAVGRQLALAIVLAAGIHVANAQPTTTLSLQEAVALASSRSADAETSRSAVQSAIEMAVAGAQLPDPVLKVGVNNVPADGRDKFSLGTDFMTMRSISVIQEFTRSDKRLARSQRFEAEASSAETQRTVALAAVQRGTAVAWLDRWYAEHVYNALAEQTDSVKLQIAAAEASYRGNRGSRADIVAARLELEQLQDREDEALAAVTSAKAMLRRWVGASTELPLAERPAFDPPAWLDSFNDTSVESLPDIAAANAQVGVAEAESRVARENKIPDVSVELMYSQRGPAFSNMVSLNVSLPLPWDQKHRQDRELAAKLAQADAARAQAEVMRRNLVGQIRGKQEELRLNQARLERYRSTTIPLAKTQTEAALTTYRAGTGTLAGVADASRKALTVSLERIRLEAATARLWADLTFLMPLPTAEQATLPQGVQR